jgi:hypothetical protein
MELLLNLAWLLLAVPAYWLWRRGATSRGQGKVTSLQFILALACALILLFPVISATDDLHAMRAAMEDAAVSKRALCQAAGDKASGRVNRVQGTPLILAGTEWLPALEVRLIHNFEDYLSPLSSPSILNPGRAPPVFLLG